MVCVVCVVVLNSRLSLSSYAVSRTPEDSKICLAALSPSPENPDPHNYGVFLKPGQRMIGVVGAFRSKYAEAGYIFNEAFWGRGYASEALPAFLHIHWQRVAGATDQTVSARVHPDNAASVRVLRKCGFRDVEEVVVVVGGKEDGLLLLRVEKPVEAVDM